MSSRSVTGFSLIELLIAVTIFVILMALGMPLFTDFLNNTQVRNAAEAMLNGVQQAQATAVRANWQTQLIVDPATGWTIQYVNPDTSVSVPSVPAPYALSEGASHALVTAKPDGATQITFDGFGRIIANPDASATVSCLNVTTNSISSPRSLRVVVSNTLVGAGTKLCDPQVAATEPQGCPAAACQ